MADMTGSMNGRVFSIGSAALTRLSEKQEAVEKWARITYQDAFWRMTNNPEYRRKELEYLRAFLFDHERKNSAGELIAGRKMDGFSVARIGPKNNRCTDVMFDEVYRYMEETGFIKDINRSPVHFLYTFIWRYLMEHPEVSVAEAGMDIARSLHFYPSAMREECLSLAFQVVLPDAEVSSTFSGDRIHKTDISIRLLCADGLRRLFRVWSYQATGPGLSHFRQKFSGQRGSIDPGLHLLAPLSCTGFPEGGGYISSCRPCTVHSGWYLYSWEYVRILAAIMYNLSSPDRYENVLRLDDDSALSYLSFPHLIAV